jgi:hypothetical protein
MRAAEDAADVPLLPGGATATATTTTSTTTEEGEETHITPSHRWKASSGGAEYDTCWG